MSSLYQYVAKVSRNLIVNHDRFPSRIPVCSIRVAVRLQCVVKVHSFVPVLVRGLEGFAVRQLSIAKLSVRSMTERRSASSIQAIVDRSPPTLTTETELYSG